MASWFDFVALILTIAIFGGVIYGVVVVSNLVNNGVSSTKENLKKKGLDISESGLSIKTSKRFDRQDYIDATQRGFIKTMDAASFRKGEAGASPSSVINRSNSGSSMQSNGNGSSGDLDKKSSHFRK